MEFTKSYMLFLITAFLGLLLYPAGDAFSQSNESDEVLNFENVLLADKNHFKDGNISQKGFLNLMFIWPTQDSLQYTVSEFEGSQSGILNQAIIFSRLNAAPFNAYIDQQGVRNRLTILQGAGDQYISKDDSTVSKKNSVTIRQKGNGNRATVIQN